MGRAVVEEHEGQEPRALVPSRRCAGSALRRRSEAFPLSQPPPFLPPFSWSPPRLEIPHRLQSSLHHKLLERTVHPYYFPSSLPRVWTVLEERFVSSNERGALKGRWTGSRLRGFSDPLMFQHLL